MQDPDFVADLLKSVGVDPNDPETKVDLSVILKGRTRWKRIRRMRKKTAVIFIKI